ncbi:hypothetical protein AHAS_Ahas10G0147600 [Arachis hypogaea]
MRLACDARHLPWSQRLACHAWMFKWHAKVLACHALLLKWHALVGLLELACHTFDTKLHAQLFALSHCLLACHALLLKWHAHSIVGLISLACHALVLKWHAHVNSGTGVSSLRHKVARHSGGSSSNVFACHALLLACHAPLMVFNFALSNVVPACHAQLLACHANTFLWRLFQVARLLHMPHLFCCFLSHF